MESTTTKISNFKTDLNKLIAKKELKLSAGTMPLKDGKIKPDTSKGEIRIFEQDGLLQFQWTNLDKKMSDDPLAIFSCEWEWSKIPSAKGRVYVLKSKCFEEEQFYYWMQSPTKDEDAENEQIINMLLDAGNFECLQKLVFNLNDNSSTKQEKSDKGEITGFNTIDNQSNPNVNNNNNNISGQNGKSTINEDFIKNIASSFKNIKRNNN